MCGSSRANRTKSNSSKLLYGSKIPGRSPRPQAARRGGDTPLRVSPISGFEPTRAGRLARRVSLGACVQSFLSISPPPPPPRRTPSSAPLLKSRRDSPPERMWHAAERVLKWLVPGRGRCQQEQRRLREALKSRVSRPPACLYPPAVRLGGGRGGTGQGKGRSLRCGGKAATSCGACGCRFPLEPSLQGVPQLAVGKIPRKHPREAGERSPLRACGTAGCLGRVLGKPPEGGGCEVRSFLALLPSSTLVNLAFPVEATRHSDRCKPVAAAGCSPRPGGELRGEAAGGPAAPSRPLCCGVFAVPRFRGTSLLSPQCSEVPSAAGNKSVQAQRTRPERPFSERVRLAPEPPTPRFPPSLPSLCRLEKPVFWPSSEPVRRAPFPAGWAATELQPPARGRCGKGPRCSRGWHRVRSRTPSTFR